ncbi:Type I restriction-modification system, DNA methylase subunit [Actinacidiphila alni]|uniref:Type I restriction-modification system, DNA methylase subunit n=1 Tax=Actinacidiphila alni TaxID=380248 RepID=A0A1I2JDD0_9ACTN|nr:N-6 DNA methylase [Actinacidiphila alni]SFF52554.1 Type I restriction-modification system, DNA methylase subunit [Actinacidiphila alni]
MPKPSALVTAAEISRLAGVTRATVSNWRRRHPDFPAPSGGTDASPLYDLEAVRAWLEARGQGAAASSAEELRSALRLAPGGSATRLVPFVLAAGRLDRKRLDELAALADADLADHAGAAVAALGGSVPASEGIGYKADEVSLLRSLIRCVRDEGGQDALDVLAERELEDSAATGTYSTPAPLADLMARLAAPTAKPYPERVLDPSCGGGSLLAAAARLGATHLYGQDVVPVQAQRSAVRLLLTAPDAEVVVRSADSLRDDAFPDLVVDAVLCNPPYADRDWGHDALAYDPRWAYGVPPRAESELAWNQHALSHLGSGGLAVMLLPPATAARASGRRIRAELLRGGALRAVIALPPGASVPLHIGLHVWILQRPGPSGPDRGRVLFIDTVDSDQRARGDRAGTQGGRAPLDWDALTSTVLRHWQAFDADSEGFADEPGTARAVPVIELLDDLTDITPARHVRLTPAGIDPSDVAHRAGDLHGQLTESLTALADRAATVTGWQAAGQDPRSWRTATVADLARGGALTVHRAARAGQDRDTPPGHTGRTVLTGRDVTAGTRASGSSDDVTLLHAVVVEEGDVLLPALGGRTVAARVADAQDAGSLLGSHLHLFRPDPERLDPWFLAGFLAAKDNVSSATVGSTAVQVQAQRLRLPLLPLVEQQRYGQAFRRLYELAGAARRAADLAAEAADLLTTGLTSGALLPADIPPDTA